MFAIIGILVVFGAVAAGYLMEHGNLKVLMQPAEIGHHRRGGHWNRSGGQSTPYSEKDRGWIRSSVRGKQVPQKRYLETLKMMYDLLNQGAEGWTGGAGSAHRRPGKESNPVEVSGVY